MMEEIIYKAIPVGERLPEKEGVYNVLTKYDDTEITSRSFDGLSFTNYHGYPVTHWLERQPSASLPKSVGEVNMDEIANAYVKSQGSHYKPENTKHDFVNGFLAGYQSAGQGREWVSVEKAIPEIGQMVLVYNTEGAILTGRLMNNGWSAFFSDGECLMQELTATHWQPVPSPPNNISTDGLENGEK